MEPGELTYTAFARVAPPELDARPWAEIDNDGRCFWMRLEAAIEHDRIAAQLAGPRVTEGDTIRVCRHCEQRLGERHILTCRNRRNEL